MCKQSSTRSKGLSSTMPFPVGHIAEFVPVNRRFRLELVLISNRAIPSLLTCKRAFRAVVFQLNLKYLHVKITNLLWV